MGKHFYVTCAVVLFVAGYAQAADVVQSDVEQSYEPPEVVYTATPPSIASSRNSDFDWGGFYIGGQLGGSWADSDVSGSISSGSFIIPGSPAVTLWGGRLPTLSADMSSFVGGLYAGYNFDLGNEFVVGVETDIIHADIDDRTSYNSFDVSAIGPGTGFLVSRVGIEQKWAGATRLRLGYDVDAKRPVLPYITAGVAYGQIKSSANAYLSATPGGPSAYGSLEYNFRDKNTFVGWTVGTGADYAVSENVLLRLEYRYADYGSKTYQHTIPGGGSATVRYKVDHRTHDLRLGAAYKF